MTTEEAAARIDAQKWREMADDLANMVRELMSENGHEDHVYRDAGETLETYDFLVSQEEEGK